MPAPDSTTCPMPEGAEIWALALALQRAGVACRSHGKHLIVGDQDFTFGLAGRVRVVRDAVTGTMTVEKVVRAGAPCGDVKRKPEWSDEDHAGVVDWATATCEQLRAVIATWRSRPKNLGALLLDQSLIAGVGVAWGSEILHAAGGLRPDVRASLQNLDALPVAMCAVRDATLARYAHLVEASSHDLVHFVNNWFQNNLYANRGDLLHVYHCGEEVATGGRTWWVSSK